MSGEAGPAARTLLKKALDSGDLSRVQVAFVTSVLEKYRQAGLPIKRTNTVGRVVGSSWKLDFGIGPGEETVHASVGDLARLPEAERQHWAMHLAQLPFAENYVKMLLHPGNCIDDGDTRDW